MFDMNERRQTRWKLIAVAFLMLGVTTPLNVITLINNQGDVFSFIITYLIMIIFLAGLIYLLTKAPKTKK